MIITPTEHPYGDIYKLMIGCIVPRPIAFVSTVNAQGRRNLAPFSFFNGVCSRPPIICFSPVTRSDGKQKDTLNNIVETKEFVVNIVPERIAAQMNICSGDFPP